MARAYIERPLRLLHIDDDPVNRLVLGEMLAALGHHPTSAATGDEALEQLQQQTFDAVLTDIHMPGMDGVALREHVGRLHPELAVFAVTADVMTRSQSEYETLGFAGVLTKPLSLANLSGMLALARRPRHRRPFLAFGSIRA
jgi:two-component system sensor histidine kinase EvgS